MTLPVHFVVAVRYVMDFTTPLYIRLITLQAYVPAVIIRVNVHLASNVTRVGDEVSDITSVNTELQQCTGKVVRLNIKFEITFSTTVVEFNSTMALVVLMERYNFVSVDTETEGTGHFTLWTIFQWVLHLYYLSECCGLVVEMLDCQTNSWRFKPNRSPA